MGAALYSVEGCRGQRSVPGPVLHLWLMMPLDHDTPRALFSRGSPARQEDERLTGLVAIHGRRGNWSIIAKQLDRRTAKQCRERCVCCIGPCSWSGLLEILFCP